MRIPLSIAAAIGRSWFRRIVREPIPANVSEVAAESFPIPLIRSGADVLVRFRQVGMFERDIQFWGWKEWSGISVERLLAFGFAKTGGVEVGRLYYLPSASGGIAAWIAFDEKEQRACLGILGRDTRARARKTVQAVVEEIR